MRSALHQSASDPRPLLLRRRATALTLTIAAHILLVLLLLRLAPPLPPQPPAEAAPKTFQLLPESQPAPKPAPRSRTVVKIKRASSAAARPTPARPPAAKPPTPAAKVPWAVMPLDLASNDISKVPSHADDAATSGAGNTGTGKDSASAYGPGEGPGGERLYDAEWYREPTNAELSFYLPPGAPPVGWALIACRTIAQYHVDDCRALGESPLGSGLSRAMRQAAWQFRVLPPRIGGRAMIGAWVRIRIDFTERGVK